MRPTFDGWRDRLTFLGVESPILGGLIFLAALLGLAGTIWLFTAGGWDVPAWGWSLIGGFLVLTPILVPSAFGLARWLRRRNQVTVYLCNAENHATNAGKAQEKYYVPPEIWSEKKIGEWAPTPLNGGSAWQVREFDWQEDVETLYVEGTPLPAVNDDRMFTWKNYVEDIYNSLIDKQRQLARARDRTNKMGADIQEATVHASAEARERGQMLDGDATKSAWASAVDDVDDLADLDDLPDIDDYIEDVEQHDPTDTDDTTDTTTDE